MTVLRPLVLALACVLPLSALAQWQWVDKDGHRVFSDKAPPPDVPAGKILRQPGMRGASAPEPAPAAAAAAAPGAAAPGAVPKVSGKDKELEGKRKQAESAEAEKKKAQEQEQARARAENCSRARQAKATVDSGMRMARMNDKGEREILDDNARAAEGQRLQAIVDRECVQ